jgi:hypothetical protein
MSIIELETPWCFNTEELTEGEVIELGKHFVKEGVNYKYPWSNADSAQIYVGINSNNGSDYNCSIKEFDEDDNIEESVTVYTIEQLRTIIAEHLAKQPVDKLEEGVVYYVTEDNCYQYLVKYNCDNYIILTERINSKYFTWGESKQTYTKATPAQIAHYEACVKAGKYVEPESDTEFAVGKWYKYNESSYFKCKKIEALGSYKRIYHSDEICDKSYNNTPDYIASNDYEKYALEHPLEDLSEIQEFLPEGHEDLVVKPKSERYLATMKFFEQLREPERSEAIANYDEDYDTIVPENLAHAISIAFSWQEDKWVELYNSVDKGTYFKEELLVFGKYKVGDIVVDICHAPGKMVEVDKLSSSNILVYGGSNYTYDHPKYLRPATTEEVEAYNQGVRNIADIKPKDYKEAVHCTTQEEWDFVLSKFNPKGVKSDCYEIGEAECIEVVNPDTYYLGCYSNVDYLSKSGRTILSFKKWCEKYNHSYEVKPWVAQVGDWVYVLNSGSSCLLVGDIVKCDHHSSGGNAHFETFRRTNNSPNSYLSYENYRKATQEEIDSVTKTAVTNTQTEWTADNWYVEVTSQEEADAVIDAAAKMYGKTYDKYFKLNDEWKYVSLCCKEKKYSLLSRKFIHVGAKPRPITDFIQPEFKVHMSDVMREAIHANMIQAKAEAAMATGYVNYMQELTPKGAEYLDKLHQQTQQDELVIYKPKQTRLVEPGAVSASVSTTNLIIKSNSKYL